MRKKTLTFILALVCLLCCSLALAACGGYNDNGNHTHNWSATYTQDGNRHYQTCDGCNEKNYGEHEYGANGLCVCGKQNSFAEHTHVYSQTLEKNETHHWYVCTVTGCMEKNGYAAHIFSNGNCVCGAVAPSQVTVTFVSLGGNVVEPITGFGGASLILPTPTRNGYNFVGWCTDAALNNVYSFAQMPNEDITLYAKWEKIEAVFQSEYLNATDFTEFTDNALDVLFPGFDGQKIMRKLTSDDVGVIDETRYSLNTNLQPSGDNQIKWYSDADFTQTIGTQRSVLHYGDNIFFATVTNRNDMILETFLVNIYVRFDFYYKYYDTSYVYANAYGTEPIATIRTIEGDYAEAPRSPENSYEFLYWTNAEGAAVDLGVKPSRSMNVYAHYAEIMCAVDSDGGSGSAEISYVPFTGFAQTMDYDKTDKVFGGLLVNGEHLCDETGAIMKGAREITADQVKSLTAQWLDYTQNKYFTFSETSGGYSVAYCAIPANKKLYIPSAYNNRQVVAISSSGFASLNDDVEIKIPRSITNIGERAFYSSERLADITIPENVTYIGKGAFEGCRSLESITIPFVGESKNETNNTHFGYIFGASTYSDNIRYCPPTLKTVVVTGGDYIRQYAFYDCIFLENLTIPFVGESRNWTENTHFTYIFGAPSTTTGSLGILHDWVPYSLNVVVTGNAPIKANAFWYCRALKSLIISDGVTSIGAYAFCGCTGLTSVTLPDSITSISQNMFSNCVGLTSLTIPDGVTSIGDYAFSDCSGLTDIVVPNSVTSIGRSAFDGCKGITELTILNSMTDIELQVFDKLTSLTSITVDEGNLHYSSDQYGILYNKDKTEIVYVPQEIRGTVVLPATLTSIGERAFVGRTSLLSVTIPESVEIIGENAFSGATSCTVYCEAAEKPSGWDDKWVNTSSNYYVVAVVWNCTSASGTTVEGSYFAVDGVHYYIKNNKAYVGKQVADIHGDIIIPQNVTYNNTTYPVVAIEAGAFYGCSRLTSVTIPEGVDRISEGAFSRCFGLTSVSIPDSVVSISNEAFYGCRELIDINIPKNVWYIGRYAFYDCSRLTSITIPDSVTSIDEYAFERCSSLTRIVVSSRITSMGTRAFYSCRSLTIYCEINSASGWGSNWAGISPVVWNCKNNDKDIDGYAYTVIEGIRYSLKDGKATVIAQPVSIGGTITIPSSVMYKNVAYNVTSIAEQAFENCTRLVHVTVSDSVTSIGLGAFKQCGLVSMTIPFVGASRNGTTNTHFGYIFGASSYTDNSRYVPSSLTTLTVTGGNSIGQRAFNDCTRLENVTFSDSVKSIGESAFYRCGRIICINFMGTKLQWSAVSKGNYWNQSLNNYCLIRCTDEVVEIR